MLELYLGGARSGKSRLAEERARASGRETIYIATATADDEEMVERIAHHRARRGEDWITVEEPDHLAGVVARYHGEGRCLLIDCLTLWLSNWLIKDNEESWLEARQSLLTALERASGHIIMVSNEVGQGVVPANRLARLFVDEAGRLHQELAARCDRVVFVTAGIPQLLKGE